MQFLRRWRPRHLLVAWSAYWLGLLLVTLGPAIPAVMRATRADAKGNISASMGDGGIKLTVMDAGTTLWDGSISLFALALWIVGPPVLLWLAWLFRRPARADDAMVRRDGTHPVTADRAALAEPAPDLVVQSRLLDARQRERERERERE